LVRGPAGMGSADVIFVHPGGRGWGPVEVLARLAAQYLPGMYLRLDAASWRWKYLRLPRIRGRRRSNHACIVIAPRPSHLTSILSPGVLQSGYDRILGWVIDSFWDDRIPMVAKRGRYYDHIFVTESADVLPWQRKVQASVSVLPWGADVLSVEFRATDKDLDLLRVGRQPPAWQDDERTAVVAKACGLTFAGRPPVSPVDVDSMIPLRAALQRAKYVLAFSNRVSPGSYTHPTKEYLTGRFTDILGHGAVVAGALPRSSAVEDLLWPESTIEIDPSSIDGGMKVIAAAVDAWSPKLAHANYRQALRRLDWRHRLKVLCQACEVQSEPLMRDLEEIERKSR